MAFTLTEFKQGLAQGGARSSLFNVEFSYPTSITTPQIGSINSSELLVKATSIPASTVGSYEVFYHGKAVKVAGDRTFDTWDTTIINDEDFAIRYAIEEWMQLISDHKLNTRDKQISTSILEGENAEYNQDMVVKQFGKDGKVVRKYQFFGAFPTALSAINLDWGTQDIEEFTCTWTYDRWNTIQ